MTLVDVDQARALTKAWARNFDERHDGVRDPAQLRRIYRDEQRAPGANSMERLGRAMAALDFALFVTALLHYADAGTQRNKWLEAQRITGLDVSRREYWNQLDRVHHYLAGVEFGSR